MNDQERPLISMWTSACTSMNKCECHSHSEAFHTKAHAKKKQDLDYFQSCISLVPASKRIWLTEEENFTNIGNLNTSRAQKLKCERRILTDQYVHMYTHTSIHKHTVGGNSSF